MLSFGLKVFPEFATKFPAKTYPLWDKSGHLIEEIMNCHRQQICSAFLTTTFLLICPRTKASMIKPRTRWVFWSMARPSAGHITHCGLNCVDPCSQDFTLNSKSPFKLRPLCWLKARSLYTPFVCYSFYIFLSYK